MILLPAVLAMAVAPLRLPAASCILSNAPSETGCKPHCCANMTCCKVSGKNKSPGSQPLAQENAAKQQLTALPATLLVIVTGQFIPAENLQRKLAPARAHSLPPLAASCIRLI
jgi:hypothetical protein